MTESTTSFCSSDWRAKPLTCSEKAQWAFIMRFVNASKWTQERAPQHFGLSTSPGSSSNSFRSAARSDAEALNLGATIGVEGAFADAADAADAAQRGLRTG